MVYFIGMGGTDFVKIGFTGDIDSRLSKMRSDNPCDLRVLACYEGDRLLERSYHRKFVRSRVRGDWFRFSEEIKKFLEAGLELSLTGLSNCVNIV